MIMLRYFLSSNWSSFFYTKVYVNKFCSYLNMSSCFIACRHSILVYIDYDDKDFR